MSLEWIQRFAVLASALLLAACAGTIQRESASGSQRLQGANYNNVDIVLGEQAKRAQADNPLFNARDLGEFVRRRLEGRNLLNAQGAYRVEVTIEHVRVRTALAAVMLGFMAGADEIGGFVRIYDARGRQVHGYKVNASYALGGLAGGQDSTRVNWLYGKFAELTVDELAGATAEGTVAKGRAYPSTVTPAVTITAPGAVTPASPAPVAAAPAPAPAAIPMVAPPVAAVPPRAIASGFAAIDDVDAIPYLGDRGRTGYGAWLARPTPRAFAISPQGHWYATWGLTPRDTTQPSDPSERALLLCQRVAQMPCKLYAVNGAVVWTKEAQ